jgi:hypothetical protein
MTAAWTIRRRIDVTGAKPFFLLALGLYVVVAAYWWLFLRNGLGGIGGVFAVYFLTGLAAATWAISNLNFLPKILGEEERTLTVAIHGAVTAFIGGFSPILWGHFLKHGDAARGFDVGVFQWFFVSVAVGALLLSPLIARLPEEKGHSVEPILIGNAILNPFRAVTYLVNLIDLRSVGREPAKPAVRVDPGAETRD